MADVDLRTPPNSPFTKRVTLSGTTNRAQRFTLPTNADVKVTVFAVTTAAKVFWLQGDVTTDNQDVSSVTDYATVPAGGAISEVVVKRPGGGNTPAFFVASATASQVVEVTIEVLS